MDRVPQVAMAERGLNAQVALCGLCHLDLGLQRERLSVSFSVYVGLAKEQWSNREAHMRRPGGGRVWLLEGTLTYTISGHRM